MKRVDKCVKDYLIRAGDILYELKEDAARGNLKPVETTIEVAKMIQLETHNQLCTNCFGKKYIDIGMDGKIVCPECNHLKGKQYMEEKSLEELEEWSESFSPGAFGGAGYNSADNYQNGSFTGEGRRKFLQHFYDKWNKNKD